MRTESFNPESPDTPEGWARIQGMMAQLALPAVRGFDGVFRPVEIEIDVDGWRRVDSIYIEAETVTFALKDAPHDWVFRRSEGVPRWRRRPVERAVFIP